MSDISRFIADNLARIEQVAREATPGPWVWRHQFGYPSLLEGDRDSTVLEARRSKLYPTDAAHIALHDPAHVLAWVAAIRTVVAIHEYEEFHDAPDRGFCAHDQRTAGVWPCPTIRAIAGIWTDTDGWQEDWR